MRQFSSMCLITRKIFGDTDISVIAQLSAIKAAKQLAMIAWTKGASLGMFFGVCPPPAG